MYKRQDMEIAIPCFLTIAMMPFAYSISEGIAFGCISYTIIKLVRGKAKEVHPVMLSLIHIFFGACDGSEPFVESFVSFS